MKKGRDSNLAGAGAAASIVLVAVIFVLSPGMAAMAAGFLSLGCFMLYDRLGRRLWEKSVNTKLTAIEESEKSISAAMQKTREEISFLRDQVTEEEKAARGKSRLKNAPANLALPADDHEEYSMPLALRPGASAPPARRRTYEEVTAQAEISDSAVKQLVSEALRHQRIDIFLQPIVRLPQRKVRYYEMFSRIRSRPGQYLPAARYLRLGRTDLAQDIDRLLLTECLEILRTTSQMERAAPFFINITPESLKNSIFMKKLLPFLASNRSLAQRLVFEIRQDEYQRLDRATSEIMRGLAKLECAFSIDNVKSLNFDIANLQTLNIRYLKIPAQNFFGDKKSAKELAEVSRFKRKLEGNGIAVIAEKIETENMLRELADFDISYGQGYLFGRPDLQGVYEQKNTRVRRTG